MKAKTMVKNSLPPPSTPLPRLPPDAKSDWLAATVKPVNKPGGEDPLKPLADYHGVSVEAVASTGTVPDGSGQWKYPRAKPRGARSTGCGGILTGGNPRPLGDGD